MIDNEIPKNVLAIVLFGSKAKNIADDLSDTDICVITRIKPSMKEQYVIRSVLNSSYHIVGDVDFYAKQQIEAMARNASLFLWHLKLEGKVLFDRNYFEEVCSNLNKYTNHLNELKYHSQLLQDVVESFLKYGIINELDLSQLFTVCRNTCIILSHKRSVYSFGRDESFETASALYPELPIDKKLYKYLQEWKMIYERGAEIGSTLPSEHQFKLMLSSVEKLIQFGIQNV